MKILNIVLLFTLFGFEFGIAAEADSVIVNKFIPTNFIQEHKLKSPKGDQLFYSGEIHSWADLDGKGQDTYLVVGYQAYGILGRAQPICQLQVIKVDGKKYTLMGSTVIQFEDEVRGCDVFEIRDLNKDKKPEVIVYLTQGKDEGAPAIFKWDGYKLTSITPTETQEGRLINSFNHILISTGEINGETSIMSIDPGNSSAPKRFYAMESGKIILKETHAWSGFAAGGKKKETVFNPKLPSDGQYILEVKNISEHKRTVRAEVTVNGVVILKPQDFCRSPRGKVNWVHKDSDDDNDDDDDDQCKRCDPKAQVYVVIDVNGATEIKVKIFGKKNSKINITLDKK